MGATVRSMKVQRVQIGLKLIVFTDDTILLQCEESYYKYKLINCL